MSIKQMRLEKGWSQEHVAQAAGLSLRTIQRIENGQTPSLESLNALAALFDVSVADLKEEPKMNEPTNNLAETDSHAEERPALSKSDRQYLNNVKGFQIGLAFYVVIMPCLFVLNYAVSPGFIWAWIVAAGWGFGVLMHGLLVYGLFSHFNADWEQRQLDRRGHRRRG